MASAWVRLSHAGRVVASGNVALWLAESGVFGTQLDQRLDETAHRRPPTAEELRALQDEITRRGIAHRPWGTCTNSSAGVSVDYPVTRGEDGRLRSSDGSNTFDSNSLEGLRQAMTAGNPRVSGGTFTMNYNPPALVEARRSPWLAGGSQAVAPQSTPFGSRLTTPRERTEPGRVGPGGMV
jgi:hypothetical protein